jgi:hypothetical protein
MQTITPRQFIRLWLKTAATGVTSRARAKWFGVGIAASVLLWLVPSLAPYRAVVPFAGPIAVLLGIYLWRLVWSPYELYVALQKESATAVEAVMSKNSDLECQLFDQRQFQEIADALTRKHREATHDLLNVLKDHISPPPVGWAASVEIWYEEVLGIMREFRCTEQDFNHVETINRLDLAKYRSWHPLVAMTYERVDRVAATAKKYLTKAEHLSRPRRIL